MTSLFLLEAEIAELCAPLTQPSAQVRYLRSLGLTVTVKPNGRPAVVRSHAEAVLSGLPADSHQVGKQEAPPAPRPNYEALVQLIQRGRRSKKAAKS